MDSIEEKLKQSEKKVIMVDQMLQDQTTLCQQLQEQMVEKSSLCQQLHEQVESLNHDVANKTSMNIQVIING